MNYFIFDYQKNQNLIDSFLKSASIAHKEKIKSKDWFLWKFRDNPFGETILACVENEGAIVGCVALGIQDFLCEKKTVKGAFSFETFVHPNYQGKGLFKELINLAETESQYRKIKFLINFPNSKSMPGFLKSGWIRINCAEYWIKPNSFINVIFNIKEFKKAFVPNAPNFEKLNINQISDLNFGKTSDSFKSFINVEYLMWRFFTFPVSEYSVINDDNIFSIARVGHRGKLKEIQVLLVINKNHKGIKLNNLMRLYKKNTNYNIISFPISHENEIRKILIKSLFIKVPNKTNVAFKKIDRTDKFDFNKLELSAINYHTY